MPDTSTLLAAGAATYTKTDIGRLLKCSGRAVDRMRDLGRMPKPIKLGALVRWTKDAIDRWIADGCPDCRQNAKAARQ